MSHEDARDEYISALVPNAQSLKESAKELRGESASAIIAAAKAPLVAGEKTVYTIPGGLKVAAQLSETSRVLEYQIQFSDGKVSNVERVTFDETPSPANLKTFARGLVGSVYGGSDGDSPQYYTITGASDLKQNATRLSRLKKLEDTELAYDAFSELTEETRVQKDKLDAITPREDTLNSAADIDKKTAAIIKKVKSKDTHSNFDEAFRVGDMLVATDGHRLFARRGMSYGEDGKQVSTGVGSMGGISVAQSSAVAQTVSRSAAKQNHVGTMSKETAAHVLKALKHAAKLGVRSTNLYNSARNATIRADGENVTIKLHGRDVATFPQSSVDSTGDYHIAARYLSEALDSGGAVSLHLPKKRDMSDNTPLRFDTMLGSMTVMPTRD